MGAGGQRCQHTPPLFVQGGYAPLNRMGIEASASPLLKVMTKNKRHLDPMTLGRPMVS